MNCNTEITLKDGSIDYDKFMIDITSWAEKTKGGVYQVKIYEDKTQDQREYAHAVIFPFVRRKMGDLGSSVGNDGAKALMKKKFIDPVYHDFEYKGRKYRCKEERSTESLSKEEYSTFIQNIIDFCIEEFQEAPPKPRKH